MHGCTTFFLCETQEKCEETKRIGFMQGCRYSARVVTAEVAVLAECIFCKIVDRGIPSDIVYEDDAVLAFNDISPQAPCHVQFIPKQHVSTVNDVDDAALLGKLVFAARAHAKRLGFAERGYRLVMNCNGDGGQTVYHLHLHLLAGRQLRVLG